MRFHNFVILLLLRCSFAYEATTDDIGTLLETLDDINDQEETEDLEHELVTDSKENDAEVLRELSDITDTLERTANDEELTTTSEDRKGTEKDEIPGTSERTASDKISSTEIEDLQTSNKEGTMTEVRRMLAALDAMEDAQQDQQKIKYELVGCYKDNQVDPRPLPELLADLSGEVDWYDPSKVIKKCARFASEKGYTVFGLQSFGHCRSGEDAAKTYKSDGESAGGCGLGLGGLKENLVFKIIPQKPPTTVSTKETPTSPPEQTSTSATTTTKATTTESTTSLPTTKPKTIPSECESYVTLNTLNRSENFDEGVSSCDEKMQQGWYRFAGPAGNMMSTTCVPKRRCGTHAPGWLNGPHPALHEGTVRREVCFHWKSCCSWRISVLVRNCGAFFVYYLSPPTTCNLRYCGNGLEPTTPPFVSTVTTTEPAETTTPAPSTKTTTGSKDTTTKASTTKKFTTPETTTNASTTKKSTTPETTTKASTTTTPETTTMASTTEKSTTPETTTMASTTKKSTIPETTTKTLTTKKSTTPEITEITTKESTTRKSTTPETTTKASTTKKSTTPVPSSRPPPSLECLEYSYMYLDSADRSMYLKTDRQSAKCDESLQFGWYRFRGDAGKQMPTSCVAVLHCGTHAPGWLNSTSHPTVAQGAVHAKVCFHWGDNCCRWSAYIRVRNCSGFYVYELSKPPYCRLRYCGNGAQPSTTSPATKSTVRSTPSSMSSHSPTLPTNPTNPSECLYYKFLDESNRAQGYSSKNRPAICDNTLLKDWYRFRGGAGDKMLDYCVDKLSCGTHAPGWLNTSHPSVADGIVDSSVCFHWGSDCCYWSTKIKVRNCGGFFVYQLNRTPYCSLRYCGNRRQVPTATTQHSSTTRASPTPTPAPECSGYIVISDGDRSQSYEYKKVQGAQPACDRRLSKAWYRFKGLAGDRMPDKYVPPYHCGTHAPGWINGVHPEVSEGVVSRIVCFSWRNKNCTWRLKISVRNCGDFYVYQLQRVRKCKLRYCGVGQNALTTPKITTTKHFPTPSPSPTPTRQEHGFIILCLPAEMHVHIKRKSLPAFVDPRLLRLDDPRCGVVQMDDNDVMLTTPLKSCGTTRRTYDEHVSFHNKVVAESGVGLERSLLEFPFRCSYKKLPSASVVNNFQPLYKRGQVMDSTFADYEE